MSPGPPSPSKRREQERAAIVHGTCRGRMPPTVPARTLLCGGADVLACKIRFSPEIEATRNGWCAWAPGRAALAVHYAVREEGAGSCAWGVMPSPLLAVRMKRFGHLVPRLDAKDANGTTCVSVVLGNAVYCRCRRESEWPPKGCNSNATTKR